MPAFDLSNLGLRCCEHLVDLGAQTTRKFLQQVDTDREAWLRGDGTDFLAATGRIALDHWASTVSCGVELQRQVLVGLTKK